MVLVDSKERKRKYEIIMESICEEGIRERIWGRFGLGLLNFIYEYKILFFKKRIYKIGG